MADYAQILLLPPPQPPQQRLPARESDLAVNADAQQGGDSARARRFRFRVYEGNDSSETSTDVARRAGARGALPGAESAAADSAETSTGSSAGFRYSYNRNSGYAASSAFVAQSIAQEHLSDGLHNPPNAAAAFAYNRAGAALNTRASAGLDITA
jgi:hypothetical protein